MQIQRMEIDQANQNDHHPTKATMLNQNENADCLKNPKNSKTNNKKLRGNRVFGADLTNQQRQISNTNNTKNNNNKQFRGLKNKNNEEKNQGFNFVKPPIVVVNDENNKNKEDEEEEEGEDNDVVIKERSSSENIKNKKKKKTKRKLIKDMEEEEEGEGEESENEDIDIEYTESQEIAPWDISDINNDCYVTDYVDLIMKNLRSDEILNRDGCIIENEFDFMESQRDVNSRMRSVLVDWLIEVHRKFKLLPATYFLGINILDRFLAKKQLHRKKLQLAGCTALWIASKYHEIYAPEMDDFVYISDNAFSDSELQLMEVEILKTLSFNLTVPTVLNYGERYSKISSYYLKKEKEMKIICDLIMYCIEHCVLSYNLCRKLPSLIGAASFVYSCLSTKVFSINTFNKDKLDKVIGYNINQLLPTMNIIHQTVKNAKRSKYKAVYKKYCNPKYSNIGKLNFEKLFINFLNNQE